MKTINSYKPLILMVIIIGCTFLTGCKNKNMTDQTTVNENIIQTKEFMVNTESTDINTYVKGTLFVKGTEETPEQMQIVAFIEVDPDDWGGVAFYIPKNWKINNILSSYSENESKDTLQDHVTTWTCGDEKLEWQKFIEVGRNRNYVPTGGSGTVIIDLVIDKNDMSQLEQYNITIAVGSDEKNGVKIIETDSISIEIP